MEVTMPALIRAEILALRTIRSGWAVFLGTLLVTAVLAVRPVLGAGTAGAPSLGTAGALLAVLDAPARGAWAMLLLGVLAVTADVRHGTLTAVLLRTPRRVRVLAAKAAAVAVVAGVAAVAGLGITLAVGLAGGAVRPSMVNADIVLHVAGLQMTYPLYGVAGVAVGALVRAQPVAVLLPLAWLLYLEGLVLRLLPAAGPWSVNGVTAALAHAGDVAHVLPAAVGGTALLAYAVLLLALGAARLARRDIT
jgi:hypothetical protein